jgi:imidazoleglycerol phosphate synthase glutamine amidotransferase subunit HisH|tara:strand:- start:194 stop:454 length:261 start_codon:yes stop_codon:yes gene_type:complete
VKYVLVDKGDNIVEKVDLESEVGISGARTYFLKSKGIDKKEFENMWKVMSYTEYGRKMESALRNPSSSGIQWWKEDRQITDEELKF